MIFFGLYTTIQLHRHIYIFLIPLIYYFHFFFNYGILPSNRVFVNFCNSLFFTFFFFQEYICKYVPEVSPAAPLRWRASFGPLLENHSLHPSHPQPNLYKLFSKPNLDYFQVIFTFLFFSKPNLGYFQVIFTFLFFSKPNLDYFQVVFTFLFFFH